MWEFIAKTKAVNITFTAFTTEGGETFLKNDKSG